MPDDPSLEELERELSRVGATPAADLRPRVTAAVHAELRSQRASRRHFRVALATLALGLAANAWVLAPPEAGPPRRPVIAQSDLSAVTEIIAEATDRQTAERIQQRLLAMRSAPLNRGGP